MYVKKNVPYALERTSVSTSFCKNTRGSLSPGNITRGSLSLEAALVTPIFFLGMVCLVYLLEMMAIQTAVNGALCLAGRSMAGEAYSTVGFSSEKLEKKVVESLGKERLNQSIIEGGAEGISCRKSTRNPYNSIMNLSAAYRIKIPVLMFHIPSVELEEKVRIKGWTGAKEGIDLSEGQEMVYITDYGMVYHKDRNCTYLNLSLRSVKKKDVEGLRNQSGGKYYPCEDCGKEAVLYGSVYITDYGDRYHTSLDCSKIKRGIYKVPLEDVYGRGGCSKCVK